MLHVSVKSLTQRFKAAMKKTVHEYQVDLKLDMAFMLIQEDPQRPLKDLAQNMGFYDEFHFSRQFKRRFGYPPLALKKKSRG
jgi:AraC-like DNA-binding protein